MIEKLVGATMIVVLLVVVGITQDQPGPASVIMYLALGMLFGVLYGLGVRIKPTL